MKKFFKYSIQQRKYSSNAIQGHYFTGDDTEQTVVVFMSALPKTDGDREMQILVTYLNDRLSDTDSKESAKVDSLPQPMGGF